MIHSKDLTREFPHSPLDELDGLPWLPRLIDKVRALQAGRLGDYTPFPCGGDRRFLEAARIEAAQLKAHIDSGAADPEIVAWVKAHAGEGLAERMAAYRQWLLAPLSGERLAYLEGMIAEWKQTHPDLDPSKVDNFTRLLCLEEGHPCPGL